MFNPQQLIKKQKQQKKEQKQKQMEEKQRAKINQQITAEKERERKQTFEKLMQGNICTKEELEIMREKHEIYRKHGDYFSVLEKDSKGFNIQPKEFMDIYYIPIPRMMAEIKILNRSISFARDAPRKEEMCPLEQKYFQSLLLKYCFTEIRRNIRRNYENINPAVQKLILGKYSFERYLNYHQRLAVTSKDMKIVANEDIDISVVPVPKLPVPIVHREAEESIEVEKIVPRNTMILNPIGAYQNPMDYYLKLIRWCRHCAHYDNCPEALQEAIFELMGNEGKYKEVFSDPTKMLQFIKSFAGRHQYFIMCLGSEEKYANFMIDYITENGRYLIMQKVTRILGHWGLSQEIKTNAYLELKNHFKVTHEQIKKMYLNPKELAKWLKAFIPKSYTTKDVDAAMDRHGFYYY